LTNQIKGNFHLKNGAEIYRLNFLAEKSTKALQQSCGMLVNYKYVPENVVRNSETYQTNCVIKTSDDSLVKLAEKVEQWTDVEKLQFALCCWILHILHCYIVCVFYMNKILNVDWFIYEDESGITCFKIRMGLVEIFSNILDWLYWTRKFTVARISIFFFANVSILVTRFSYFDLISI